MLAEHEPLLARTLADALAAAWLTAGAELVGRVRAPGPAATLPGGRRVGFTAHEKAAAGEALVWVDPRKLDADWRREASYYLPPAGQGAGRSEVKGRREVFGRFLEKGQDVQAPRVAFDPDSPEPVSFIDGRHRFAVLRDAGADRVAVMVDRRQAAAFEARYGAGPPAPPPPFELLAPGEPEPVVRFPQLEAAAGRLASRQVLTRPDYDRLAEHARAQAFTIAKVQSLDALTKLQDALAGDVRAGGTLAQFAAAADEALGASALGAGHVETVYRTNVAQAYADGQQAALDHPLVAGEFPYVLYTAVHDGRVDPDHLAMEQYGIQGTAVYRSDDPVIRKFWPPWRWNCRCHVIPLTLEDAAALGIREAQDWLRGGVPPERPAFVAMPPFEPPPGWGYGQTPVRLSVAV